MQGWLEYLRAGQWVPSDDTRTEIVYSVRVGRSTLRVLEDQRLYFGRWGRFKWKKQRRYVRWEGAS